MEELHAPIWFPYYQETHYTPDTGWQIQWTDGLDRRAWYKPVRINGGSARAIGLTGLTMNRGEFLGVINKVPGPIGKTMLSDERGHYCLRICKALNEAGVFPAPLTT